MAIETLFPPSPLKSTVSPQATVPNPLGVSPIIPDESKSLKPDVLSTTPHSPANSAFPANQPTVLSGGEAQPAPPQITTVAGKGYQRAGQGVNGLTDPNYGRMISGPLFSGTDRATAYNYVGTDTHVTAADGSTSNADLGLTPTTDTTTAAAAIIRREEGYGATGQWDVNAIRGGYGSDTYTTQDGQVVKLTYRGQPVSKDDAERDVQRRIPILNAQAAKQVGPAYTKLPGYVQGALISIVDNYGHLPSHVVAAAQGGNLQMLGDAVAALGSDNGGIRAARYNRVANIIRGTAISGVGP